MKICIVSSAEILSPFTLGRYGNKKERGGAIKILTMYAIVY